MMMTLPRMLERPPWDLQQLCEAYQYRHDRQASALHDAMDNQVSFSSSPASSLTDSQNTENIYLNI